MTLGDPSETPLFYNPTSAPAGRASHEGERATSSGPRSIRELVEEWYWKDPQETQAAKKGEVHLEPPQGNPKEADVHRGRKTLQEHASGRMGAQPDEDKGLLGKGSATAQGMPRG